jgi:hypothetical protein
MKPPRRRESSGNIRKRVGREAAFIEASADAELWRDLPSSDYGMASKVERPAFVGLRHGKEVGEPGEV